MLLGQTLRDLIDQRRFGVEYQPIVSIRDGGIIGYEALARFYDAAGSPLSPQIVFNALHASPSRLFHVEYEMKKLQIAHAPADASRLFLNLDPDAYQAGRAAGPHPLVTLLACQPGVVVEIIENSSINDAVLGDAMASELSESRIPLALDDIGAPGTMLSLPTLFAVDFLKFDRSWCQHLDDPVRCAALRHLVGFARECGKKTVLEGIECESQLAFAARVGLDCVQGFLYRRWFRQTGWLSAPTVRPPADRACDPVPEPG